MRATCPHWALSLIHIFPIGLQAQSEVIVLHPDEGKAEVNEAEYTRIFLAGTIDMGKSIDLSLIHI